MKQTSISKVNRRFRKLTGIVALVMAISWITGCGSAPKAVHPVTGTSIPTVFPTITATATVIHLPIPDIVESNYYKEVSAPKMPKSLGDLVARNRESNVQQEIKFIREKTKYTKTLPNGTSIETSYIDEMMEAWILNLLKAGYLGDAETYDEAVKEFQDKYYWVVNNTSVYWAIQPKDKTTHQIAIAVNAQGIPFVTGVAIGVDYDEWDFKFVDMVDGGVDQWLTNTMTADVASVIIVDKDGKPFAWMNPVDGSVIVGSLEVADFTPKTIPDSFENWGVTWTKTSSDTGEIIWINPDAPGIVGKFVDNYCDTSGDVCALKDRFMFVIPLGRVSIKYSPNFPALMQFKGDIKNNDRRDPSSAYSAGEEIILRVLPQMNYNYVAQAKILDGADFSVLVGDYNVISAHVSGGPLQKEVEIFNGDVKIGKIHTIKWSGYEIYSLGPYVDWDGSVVVGSYLGDQYFATAKSINNQNEDITDSNSVYWMTAAAMHAAEVDEYWASVIYSPAINRGIQQRFANVHAVVIEYISVTWSPNN